jgi:hypothetical protein
MLETVNSIYECSASCKLNVHEVFDRQVYNFSKNLSTFLKFLHETGQAETWKEFTGRLKKYRFFISASPLPFDNEHLGVETNRKRLSEFIELQTFALGESSDVIGMAKGVFDSYLLVSSSGTNSLDSKFNNLLNSDTSDKDIMLVLLDNALVQAVKGYFISKSLYKYVDVLAAHELRATRSYRKIFLFGSPGWFETRGFYFIFTAPRAPVIQMITYSWVDNKIKIKSMFDCRQPLKEGKKPASSIEISVNADERTIELEDYQNFLPTIDTEKLKVRLNKSEDSGTEDEGGDIIEAKIALLAQNKASYVEYSDSASSLVIDLTERDHDKSEDDDEGEDNDEDILTEYQDQHLLLRIPNSELEEGMFLLLRTAGGGDYIVPVADVILGDKKETCRNMQKEWKDLFNIFLKEKGTNLAMKKIKDFGGKEVTEATLRNWARLRNIRPGNIDNFRAILCLVGLEDLLTSYFKNTEIILQAHRKAGNVIRKLLLEQIKKSDLKKLKTEGSTVFNLPSLETLASITAYRIERILPDVHHVPYYRLGHPVDLGDDLWQ